jgi:hypothetical protein
MQSVANNWFLANFISVTPENTSVDATRYRVLPSGFGLIGASFIRIFVPAKTSLQLFNTLLSIPGFLQFPHKDDLPGVVGIMHADIGDRRIPFF